MTRLLPRRRTRTALTVVSVALVAGVALGLVARSFGLVGGDAPPPVALPAAGPAPAAAAAAQDLAGSWVVTGEGFVGYRVQEPALDREVVGRTSDVQGTAVVTDDGDALVLADAQVEADLRALTSDAAARDRALRGRLLQTDRFPRAVFTLEGPVALGEPGDLRDGAEVTVPGRLEVRETERPVTVDLAVRVREGRVDLAGSAPVALSDFGVEIPAVSPARGALGARAAPSPAAAVASAGSRAGRRSTGRPRPRPPRRPAPRRRPSAASAARSPCGRTAARRRRPRRRSLAAPGRAAR